MTAYTTHSVAAVVAELSIGGGGAAADGPAAGGGHLSGPITSYCAVIVMPVIVILVIVIVIAVIVMLVFLCVFLCDACYFFCDACVWIFWKHMQSQESHRKTQASQGKI